jgi:A/G-specific adenine glycosylase
MRIKKTVRPKRLQPIEFQKKLLTWFEKYGRKNLPWQSNKTPYRVWISEIMLQQTQVSTVIDYFQRFIKEFPDVMTLAKAKEDEVLHLWTGLGYYQRARHLHQTAKIIYHTYQGHFPDELAKLEALPGIGKSTAGAILSIAFEKSAAILDGNVKRVLTRLYGIMQWPGEKKTTEKLWKIAEKYTPQIKIADYTQAIMDLGATVCIRNKPACMQCPFNSHCIAHAKGMAARLPHPKPRKTLPTRAATFILLFKKPYYVLLEKRSTSGVWKGLWSLPEISGIQGSKTILKKCLARFHLPPENIHLSPRNVHLSSRNVELSSKYVDLSSRNVELFSKNVDLFSRNVKLPSKNIDLSSRNVELPSKNFHSSSSKVTLGTPFRHTFSHYHLEILPALIVIKNGLSHFIDDQYQMWYNLEQAQSIGMPAPVKSLLDHLKTHGTLS